MDTIIPFSSYFVEVADHITCSLRIPHLALAEGS